MPPRRRYIANNRHRFSEEDIERIKSGNINKELDFKDLIHVNADEIEFKNIDFRGVSFKFCNIKYINFINCNFQDVVIDDCKFENCSFAGSNLRNTEFKDCFFIKIQFSDNNDENGANLENSSFINVNIEESYFSNVNLSGASFHDCTIRTTRLNKSNLSPNTQLSFKRKTVFADTAIINCFFNNSNCKEILFENCLIYNTSFQDANLENANFEASTYDQSALIRVNFQNTNLRNVSFENSDLRVLSINRDTILEGNYLDQFDFQVEPNLSRSENINYIIREDGIEYRPLNSDDIGYEEELPLGEIDGEQEEEYEDEELDNVVPHQPEGIAYEIHNAFDNMNIEQVFAFFDGLIVTPIQNYNPISPYVINKFNNYIDNHFNDRDQAWKNEQKRQLASIYEKFNYAAYKDDEKIRKIMGRSVDFAFNQPEELVDLYVESYIQDNFFAYEYDPRMPDGDRRSCPKGIAERTLISLGEAINIYCDEHPDECNEQYQTLRNLLGLLPMYTYVQQWSEKLDNNKAKYEAMSVEQRKQDFIDFMKNIYRGFNNLTPRIEQRINEEAEKLGYVFESLEFGGGSKSRSVKKHKKTKKIKKIKKTKKLVGKIKNKKTKVKVHNKTKTNKRK